MKSVNKQLKLLTHGSILIQPTESFRFRSYTNQSCSHLHPTEVITLKKAETKSMNMFVVLKHRNILTILVSEHCQLQSAWEASKALNHA